MPQTRIETHMKFPLKPGCRPLAARGLLAGLLLGGWLGAIAAPPLPPLTSVPNSPRLPGKFVWADLVTDDVPAAQKFYSQMFGWKFWDYGGYLIALNDQRPLAGMFQRPRPKDKPAEPRWFAYLSVASVAKATRAATNNGGRVLSAAQQMPKRGEQAVFADPEGALFGVIKSSAGDPQDFLADPGDWVWIQLLSRDAAKATEFYRAVGGYEAVANTTPGRLSDYVLTSGGYARATVRTIPPSQAQVLPTWLPFVRVKNVGDSVAQAQKLGGKVLIAPKPENLAGKVAVIADPTGAAIGIMEWSEGLLKGGK
jgi:predicted enzyme related to lactoylglutathione lyase